MGMRHITVSYSYVFAVWREESHADNFALYTFKVSSLMVM